jgi:hypothetical protein
MSQHLLVRSVLTGAVSPEASEVGSVGDVYVRTDDATLWIKTTGDNTNTGWTQSANVSGDLPFSNFVQASAASRIVGRGSASGAGDFQEITLGTNLSMSGTVLNATSGAGGGDVDGPASSVDDRIATFDGITGKLLQDSGDTIADVVADAVTAATAAILPIDLAADVTGDLPLSSFVPASAASKLIGRGAGGGAGDYQEITLGTNLSMSGATLNATGGGGGGLVLLEQYTASSSATLDFTTFISSTYDTYMFALVDVLPATSTADLWVRMGTGGGPTWDAGANYTWAHLQHSQIPSSATLGAAGANQIKIGHSLGNGSTNGVSGEVKFYNPQSTAVYKRLTAHLTDVDSAGNFVGVIDSGQYVSTTAVTGVRFLMSSGNIASGTIRAYGLEK